MKTVNCIRLILFLFLLTFSMHHAIAGPLKLGEHTPGKKYPEVKGPTAGEYTPGANKPKFTCGGKNITYSGSPNSDTKQFGLSDDVIHGFGGHDQLKGGNGHDTICGGHGNDALFGGLGNDTLYGQAGNDRLYGGPGQDVLNGGPGFDTCYITEGEDTAINCEDIKIDNSN